MSGQWNSVSPNSTGASARSAANKQHGSRIDSQQLSSVSLHATGSKGNIVSGTSVGDVLMGSPSTAVKLTEGAAKKYMQMVPDHEIMEAQLAAKAAARQARQWGRFVVHPLDWRYRIWRGITLFASCLTGWLVPFRLAYLNAYFTEASSGGATSARVELFLLGVFALDIAFSFFVGYVDKQGLLVMNNRMVAVHYLKGQFILDVMTTLPFDVIVLAALHMTGHSSANDRNIALLGLLKLGRMYRVVATYQNISYNLNVSLFALTIIRNTTFCVFWIHWAACTFWFIARQYDFGAETWVAEERVLLGSKGVWQSYLVSIYWSMVTFTTLGYGDITPLGTAELAFVTIYVAINIVVLAYMLGTITLLITKQDEEAGCYRDRMSVLNAYAEANNLPKALRKTMAGLLMLHMSASSEMQVDEQVLAIYPTAIRRQILRKLYAAPLNDCYLFKDCDSKFMDAIMMGARMELFLPKVEIISPNDHVNELYIIVAGHVTIEDSSTDSSTDSSPSSDSSADQHASSASSSYHEQPSFPVGGSRAPDALEQSPFASAAAAAGFAGHQNTSPRPSGAASVTEGFERKSQGFSRQVDCEQGVGSTNPMQSSKSQLQGSARSRVRTMFRRAPADGTGAQEVGATLPRDAFAPGGASQPHWGSRLWQRAKMVARTITDQSQHPRLDHHQVYDWQEQQQLQDLGGLSRCSQGPGAAAAAAAQERDGPEGQRLASLHMTASAMRRLDGKVFSRYHDGAAAAAAEAAAAEGAGGSEDGAPMVLGPGDCFAEVAYFTEVPKCEKVTSVTVCRVLVIPRSTLNSVAADFPLSVRRMLENLKDRVEEMVLTFLPPDLVADLDQPKMLSNLKQRPQQTASAAATAPAAARLTDPPGSTSNKGSNSRYRAPGVGSQAAPGADTAAAHAAAASSDVFESAFATCQHAYSDELAYAGPPHRTAKLTRASTDTVALRAAAAAVCSRLATATAAAAATSAAAVVPGSAAGSCEQPESSSKQPRTPALLSQFKGGARLQRLPTSLSRMQSSIVFRAPSEHTRRSSNSFIDVAVVDDVSSTPAAALSALRGAGKSQTTRANNVRHGRAVLEEQQGQQQRDAAGHMAAAPSAAAAAAAGWGIDAVPDPHGQTAAATSSTNLADTHGPVKQQQQALMQGLQQNQQQQQQQQQQDIREKLTAKYHSDDALLSAAAASNELTPQQLLVLADLLQLQQLVAKAASKMDNARVAAFLEAAAKNEVDIVQDMMRQGMNPDTAGPDGRSALMVAAFRGNTDVVLALLLAGANPAHQCMQGFDALIDAARGGHREVIDVLKVSGAKTQLSSVVQAWLLCKAAFESQVSLLQCLLAAGCQPDCQDYSGQTALHVAAAEGNLPVARVLLAAGADLTIKDRWGFTPLEMAFKVGAAPLVAFFASHVAPEVAAAAERRAGRQHIRGLAHSRSSRRQLRVAKKH